MFEEEITNSARTYNVPETWIRAIIETESDWKPDAFRAEPKVHDASYGLMQLLYGTAKRLGYDGDPTGLYDPQTNIDLGSKLIGNLRQQYGDDFRRVYSAYNSGRPDLWLSSQQVAKHVERAINNLTKWVSLSVSQFSATPESSSLVGLLVLVFLWAWAGRRK